MRGLRPGTPGCDFAMFSSLHSRRESSDPKARAAAGLALVIVRDRVLAEPTAPVEAQYLWQRPPPALTLPCDSLPAHAMPPHM